MKQRYDSYKPSGIDWIGEIPNHWKVVPLRAIAKNFIKGSGITKEDLDDNGDIACIRYGDLYTKYGVSFTQGVCFTNSNKINPKVSIQYGDILFAATGESIEEIGKSSVYLGTDNCLAGGDIIILRQNQNYLFMGYAMSSDSVQSQKSYGKAKLKVVHLKLGDVKSIKIALPPLAEQEAIAAWLDEKCGEIDAAIAKVDREIELIDELKQSEISRVVTRGLNPNVPLRPSGIDWIGEIPEHWRIAPFKRAMTINNGCDYKHIVCEDGYPVIGSGGQFAYASDYLYDGEVLLLGRKGTIDRPIHFVGKFWTVDTMFYSVPNSEVCCKFMYYQSLGFPFDYYSTATALPSMAASDLANNPIVVPPLAEQQAISDYLDKKCAEIDDLKSKLKKKRDTLVELRQSMISEVVTGKRKIV